MLNSSCIPYPVNEPHPHRLPQPLNLCMDGSALEQDELDMFRLVHAHREYQIEYLSLADSRSTRAEISHITIDCLDTLRTNRYIRLEEGVKYHGEGAGKRAEEFPFRVQGEALLIKRGK